MGAIADLHAAGPAKAFEEVRRNLSPLERAQAMEFPLSIQRILDGEVVTMAHARALARYGVASEAEQWRRRIEDDRLDARALVRFLTKEKGKRPVGRPRRYMRREGNRVRMYAFRIGKDSPRDERENVVRLLLEATELLKG